MSPFNQTGENSMNKNKTQRATNIFVQKEREIDKLREAAMNRERSIMEGPKMKDIMRQAQELIAKDEQKQQ